MIYTITHKQLLAVDAISNLKQNIIKDYNKYLHRLFKGYKDDYSYILQKISYVETWPYLDQQELIYQKLINE